MLDPDGTTKHKALAEKGQGQEDRRKDRAYTRLWRGHTGRGQTKARRGACAGRRLVVFGEGWLARVRRPSTTTTSLLPQGILGPGLSGNGLARAELS